MLLHRSKQVKMAKIKVHGISTYNPQKVTLALFEKEVRVYVHSMFLIRPPFYCVKWWNFPPPLEAGRGHANVQVSWMIASWSDAWAMWMIMTKTTDRTMNRCEIRREKIITASFITWQVDFEVVYVDMRSGQHKTPTFMSMQVSRETH